MMAAPALSGRLDPSPAASSPPLEFYWLSRSAAELPGGASDGCLDGLLNAAEQERWRGFVSDKRRGDWLLGRWTAKLLLQSVLAEKTGWRAPLDRLVIAQEESGRPYLQLSDWPPLWQRCLICLSISHSAGRAFCALTIGTGWQVGADIELVAPRRPAFVADYFVPAEQALLATSPPDCRDALTNAIWSGKEAALKMIGLGLRLDSRDVLCLPEPPLSAASRWWSMPVHLKSDNGATAGPLSGWWRLHEDYVYTLVIGRSPAGLGQPEATQIEKSLTRPDGY
jgi:4'-phosphopantetheinyl transferase